MKTGLRPLTRMCFAGLAAGVALLLPVAAAATMQQEWRFRVYLDDKPIGYHDFTIVETATGTRLTTRASFDVTFLRIPLFKYRHENTEQWDKQCLQSINSTTDENGKLYRLEGTAGEGGFRLVMNTGESILPSCISTFAYWDKSFLKNDRLLNSQTGEYLPVEVEYLGEKHTSIGTADVPTRHYRLTASDLDIELWYSHDDQWLGLQSTTGSGRMLRYVAGHADD